MALAVKADGTGSGMYPASPVIGFPGTPSCGQYTNGDHSAPSGPQASPTGLEAGCAATAVGGVATLTFKRAWSTVTSADGVRGGGGGGVGAGASVTAVPLAGYRYGYADGAHLGLRLR